jgi:hypothetical protein
MDAHGLKRRGIPGKRLQPRERVRFSESEDAGAGAA